MVHNTPSQNMSDVITEAYAELIRDGVTPDVDVIDADLHGADVQNDGFLFSDDLAYYAHVCKVYKMSVLGVSLLLVGMFGLVGNALTVFTVWPTRKSSSNSLILIVLACCDSGSSFVWWFNLGIPAICDYAKSNACQTFIGYVYPVTYLYLWPVGRWCHYCSTWVVLLVTAHRYVAVCIPLKASKLTNVRRTRIQLLVICVACFLYVLPRFCHQYLVSTPDGLKRVNNAFGRNVFWFSTFYESILYVGIIYVVPFPMLAFMTARLIVALRKTREKRNQMTRKKREEKDLTTTFVTVVIVFMVCQLPNPIRRLLVAVLPNEKRQCNSFYPYYRSLASLLLVLNSSINFVIYCFCGERFRKTCITRVYAALGKKNKVADSGASTLHPVTAAVTGDTTP